MAGSHAPPVREPGRRGDPSAGDPHIARCGCRHPPVDRCLLPAAPGLLRTAGLGRQRRRVPDAASMTAARRAADRIPPGLRRPGAPAFGTWIKLPTLETLELLADAGFEFVVVDLEHSPLGLESASRLIFGAQALGMAALVRVPDRSGALLQRLLDAGAD